MKGILRKMGVEQGAACRYTLPLGDEAVDMNALIGREINMQYTGQIFCTQCGRKTNKSFQQGYCFPCFRRLQECGCMVKPENCKFYEGHCDPDDWAHAHCGQSHIVYLANSSGLKVGITRESNVPSRWIDQGASQALAMIKTANRYQAGLVEVACKEFMADKTNWRAMLKGTAEPIDLIQKRDEVWTQLKAAMLAWQGLYGDEILFIDSEVMEFNYPIEEYPTKISTYNLDKLPQINDVLQGIKAQYLIFKHGVVNIRKFAGYEVELEV